jgi:hypothetical protein
MKKYLMFLCAVMLVFGMAGVASALQFTDTQALNVTLAEGPLADVLLGTTFDYTHATPVDFEVPWDVVNSAELEISGYWIDGNNDTVEVTGTAVGTLTSGGSYGFSFNPFNWGAWDTPSVSSFDISSTFSTWSTGALLGVSITADGRFGDGILQLASSTFTLDYENNTAPVPEPSTILLMGAGLLGLVGYNRKRFSKKS